MRTALTLLGIVAGVWLVLVVAAWALQRQIIYLPDAADPGPPPPGAEEALLETDDGLELTAWYLAPDGEAVGTILAAPGNAGNRALRAPLAEGLVQRGHAVLLLDYRGYGGNPGRPSEDGLLADARAALAHLDARTDVTAERIVLLGESLGTGVVAGTVGRGASSMSGSGVSLAEVPVVLRSPFTELADVGRAAYPFLPVRMLLRDRFPVIEDLRGHLGPILVIAGDRDRIVPTPLSKQVAAALDAPFEAIAGADHNDRALLDGDDYLDAVDRFVREVLPAD